MKKIFTGLLLIIFVVTLIAVFFTYNQAVNEEKRLRNDIQYRSTLLAENLRETVEPGFIYKTQENLQGVVEKYANSERIAGLVITDNKNKLIAASSTLPKDLPEFQKIAADVMDSDKADGDFVNLEDSKIYVFVIPIHNDKSVAGSLLIVQNAGYINTRLAEIWQTNLIRLIIQVFLLSFVILLVLRWIIYEPVKNLVDSMRLTRLNNGSPKHIPSFPFFSPLIKELSNIQKSLMEARLSASEEARLRLEKTDSPWTAERLREFIKDAFKGRTIFIVSNREPYIHVKEGDKINYFFPASGMATAVEPIMQACGGTWVAHGSGDADKLVVDNEDKIKVPPEEPKYTLRRVWLTEKEEEGYYYGFSNEGLWPLCHIAHTRPIFRKEDWEEYRVVNGKFAKAVLSEIKNYNKPIILIQDYHFALLPSMIKKSRPDAIVGLFWHIPWPNSESFSICPFRKELVDGMLGSDLIGFHTQLHCNNFIDTIGRELESLIDWEQFAVTRHGHKTFIKPFPISIAFHNGFHYKSNNELQQLDAEGIRKQLNIKSEYVGLGVDRLDYTKGIIERFKAVEYFLEKYPTYKNKFTFIQIAPPSRSRIKKYKDFENEVEIESERINKKFKSKDWEPIILLKKRFNHQDLEQFYLLANICLVTSLHDGMNLVAKEFIAARIDEKGVLILSKFTGSSRELKEAFIVNPYNIEQVGEAIKLGLEMTGSEQIRRMRKMRGVVENYNIYRWSAELLKSMIDLG